MAYVSGFCITRHHETCRKTLTYYEKTWTCECECHTTAEQAEELGN